MADNYLGKKMEDYMRLLAVGDVCGSVGCDYVRAKLSAFKKEKNIDVVIINGENSADGNGITPDSAEYLFACGADIITGGNHSFRRKEIFDVDVSVYPEIVTYDAGDTIRLTYFEGTKLCEVTGIE